jgi:sodium/potassium-transporting ATPase subunit alpha
MQGTHCISGSGLGVVLLTGDHTVFGKIAKLSSKRKAGLTTLQKEILRFVFVIISLVVVVSIIVIAVWAGFLRKQHPEFMNVSGLIIAVVSVSVAFIPEGTSYCA